MVICTGTMEVGIRVSGNTAYSTVLDKLKRVGARLNVEFFKTMFWSVKKM
jgi:hypothetical protein